MVFPSGGAVHFESRDLLLVGGGWSGCDFHGRGEVMEKAFSIGKDLMVNHQEERIFLAIHGV